MKPIANFIYTALALFAFAFALLPRVQAADGGRHDGNTAEGTWALFSLTSGFNNTATGFKTLKFLQKL